MSIVRKLMSVSSVKKPPEFSYVDSTLIGGGSGNPRTVSSFNIGAADPNRHIIVLVNFKAISTGTTLTSVTVGGQSTSIAVSTVNSNSVAAICITDNPVVSGTTADIVINASANFGEHGVAVYRAVNIDSTTATATSTSFSSPSLSILEQGCLIGNGGHMGFNGTGGNITWTNLTRNYFLDGYSFGVGYRTSGAFHVDTVGGQTRSVNVSMADEFRPVVCYASFR